MNNSASEMKPLFDQHQSSDCFWVEVCVAERNCITASRKNSFHGDSRSCTEYSKKKTNISNWQLNSEKKSICELTRNWKNIPGKTWEVKELWTATSPPLQWITSVEVLTRELEVLLNLVCERLKVSVAGCEIDLLRRAIHCRGWYYRSCGNWEWFVILVM